jgi:hypothetical protein
MQIGWRDIGPFAGMVESAEKALGIGAAAAAVAATPKLTIKKSGAAAAPAAGTNGGLRARRSTKARAAR